MNPEVEAKELQEPLNPNAATWDFGKLKLPEWRGLWSQQGRPGTLHRVAPHNNNYEAGLRFIAVMKQHIPCLIFVPTAWGASVTSLIRELGAHLTFFRSADILVRFGIASPPEADKNVRAPIHSGRPSRKNVRCARELDRLRILLAFFSPLGQEYRRCCPHETLTRFCYASAPRQGNHWEL